MPIDHTWSTSSFQISCAIAVRFSSGWLTAPRSSSKPFSSSGSVGLMPAAPLLEYHCA